MGILNVTPDSFSDGGRFAALEAALAQGRAMAAAGAAIIDVGGESTRPGARAIGAEEEIARVLPVVRELVAEGIKVSLDTRHAATMAAGLRAGVSMINDVSALSFDARARAVVADSDCAVVLMHMRGTPESMASCAQYGDVVAEVCRELRLSRDAALAAGIGSERILLDPGFGFAKDLAQNLTLLRGLSAVCGLGHPVVAGLSRKAMIGALSGVGRADGRDAGSVAAGLYALSQGAAWLRVHAVAEHVAALRVWCGIAGADSFPGRA